MLTNNEIKFIRTLHQKRARQNAQLFVAEGDKLVLELSNLFPVENRYTVGENCTEAQMAKISQLKTPSKVLATFRMPKYDIADSVNHLGKVIVLDGVQDPGNLGTILRTADWFGIKMVVCSRESADVYNSKVVQATMGAIGRVKVVYTDIVEWLRQREELFPQSSYGTFLERSDDYRDVNYSEMATIVMGNEGQGISSEVEKIISQRVHIKQGGGGEGESLNVAIATAIIISKL